MKRMSAAIAATVLVATILPASAQTPMTASEFEDHVTGKTLYYSHMGVEYGIERYLPGRRVVWSFLDGECHDGTWRSVGEMICFEYEAPGLTQCWRFFDEPGGLRAQFAGADMDADFYETREADEPMQCQGPDVGA